MRDGELASSSEDGSRFGPGSRVAFIIRLTVAWAHGRSGPGADIVREIAGPGAIDGDYSAMDLVLTGSEQPVRNSTAEDIVRNVADLEFLGFSALVNGVVLSDSLSPVLGLAALELSDC